MRRNIDRIRQKMGGKLGKCPLAHLDEDFNCLQDETEAAREALERLSDASEDYLKAVSKRIESKELPIETFGLSMTAQARFLPEDSTYREALSLIGEAHIKIGAAQREMVHQFSTSYILSLQRESSCMKEYEHLQKKLHLRKMDYDAKLAKVQKAKKEKPELSEELQSAKCKYEHVRECVLEMMMSIVDLQDSNVSSLKAYYDAQLSFARRVLEILEAVPESTFNPPTLDLSPSLSGFRFQKSGSDAEVEFNSDNYPSDHAVSSSPNGRPRSHSMYDTQNRARRNLMRGLSTSGPLKLRSFTTPLNASFDTASIHSASSVQSDPESPSQIPDIVPNQPQKQKYVRAIHNFDGTTDDELSLRKGDIIRVIEEIDEGWWDGELYDNNGIRYGGMFPTNYVEEIPNDSQQRSVSSDSSASTQYLDEEEGVYYERPTDIYDEPMSTIMDELVSSTGDIPCDHYFQSSSTRQSTIPISRGKSLDRKNNGASRSLPVYYHNGNTHCTSPLLPILHETEQPSNMLHSQVVPQPGNSPNTPVHHTHGFPIVSDVTQLSSNSLPSIPQSPAVSRINQPSYVSSSNASSPSPPSFLSTPSAILSPIGLESNALDIANNSQLPPKLPPRTPSTLPYAVSNIT